MLRTIRHHNHRLLNCRSGHIRGSVDQCARVHLPRAGYTEEGGRRLRGSLVAPERKVREVFGRSGKPMLCQRPEAT